MVPCTHPGMKRLFCLNARNGPRSLRSLGLAALKTKKKPIKLCPTQNTPRNPQPAGHRDRDETARDETRPTRQPILARFLQRSRVCGNQPRLYTYVPALLMLCRFCIRFGALFSRRRSFCFLYCEMYLRFRGCPVVPDIDLYVSAWCHKTRRALYCCCCAAFVSVRCSIFSPAQLLLSLL